MTEDERMSAISEALGFLQRAHICVAPKEQQSIEVTDFGLNQLKVFGLQVITYVNTDRYCAKELVLFPNQICPEHRHPPIGEDAGKQETFRCRWGTVSLFIEGDSSQKPLRRIPKGFLDYFTVWNEVVLRPGDQYTLAPNTKHWFQAGEEGAVISEFSSTSRDDMDVFTDPRIVRVAR